MRGCRFVKVVWWAVDERERINRLSTGIRSNGSWGVSSNKRCCLMDCWKRMKKGVNGRVDDKKRRDAGGRERVGRLKSIPRYWGGRALKTTQKLEGFRGSYRGLHTFSRQVRRGKAGAGQCRRDLAAITWKEEGGGSGAGSAQTTPEWHLKTQGVPGRTHYAATRTLLTTGGWRGRVSQARQAIAFSR